MESKKFNAEEILQSLTLEDLAGQVLCYDVSANDVPEEVEKHIAKIKPGGLFLANMTPEQIKLYTDMANKYTKVPVIVASDIENGPEIAVKGSGLLPHPMAWGACDDAALVEEAGEVVAKICRKYGVHWTFSPVVDLSVNFRSPETSVRAISDSPKQVVKIASAFADGMEKNGLMVTCLKHFPGQGTDERNSHFCTTINEYGKEKWMRTYGYIYKKMIKRGTASVMAGHCALPAFEENSDEFYGAPPAVLSKSLMADLLKNKLKFGGLIVSDAMSMIGVCSRAEIKDLAVTYLNCGGDVVLFPEPEDYDNIIRAVRENRLPESRLKDAVRRMLELKNKARLFENQKELQDSIEIDETLEEVAGKIADKSIKIVRNHDNVLPAELKKGDKVLFLNMLEPHFHREPTYREFDAMKSEFEKEGITVDMLYGAKHTKIKEIMGEYAAVIMNCKMSSQDYHGGSLRVGWNNIMALWRGYALRHPRFVFVSFGDPYKLFDFPYLKTYVNAFSCSDASQRAAAKVIMGKIPSRGKNPVNFKGFFEREV